MKYCPLCHKELELQIEEYRSGDVIDEYCPTMVKSVNGREISHFRTGGLVERTYGLIPPFRFWISPKNNETIFSAIGKKSFTQIMEKPLMSVEEAVEILKKLVNLKSFT
jgi:hypothetical protein